MNIKIGNYLLIGFSAIILLGGIFVYQQAKFVDGKLHVVFCDVGQGDGIFIRTPKGVDILVDGGPDNKVLDCLSSHMPFWDRTIEVVILTHPHADHLIGLLSVMEKYTVLSFDTEKLENKTPEFGQLLREVKSKRIPIRYLYAGDSLKTKDGIRLSILGPTAEFIQQTSPGGIIGESKEFASLITLISYGNFSILLTGDSQVEGLKDSTSKTLVLQVPHHGSKTGLNPEILQKLQPKLAVISVGKNNRYGHPAQSIIKILEDEGIKILRTDKDGQIQIVSNGQSFIIAR